MIALYSRVSTIEQATEGYSIGEQEQRLSAYCDAMEWKPYAHYTDAGFSGGNTDRPQLQKLIQDIESGLITKVIVYKLDRLSRNQLDTLFLIEKVFLAHGCEFLSITENFDTSSPFGRAMLGMLAVFAQLEKEQIRERMLLGKEARKKEGLWRGGAKTPIGYDYVEGKLVINEFEAMQIREIFDLYLKGIQPYQIEREFYKRGYAHKYGMWNGGRIKVILKNELLTGFIDGKKAIHEPIIDRETFDHVQEILKSHEKKNIRTGSSLLGGMLYCRHCGGRFGVYQCGNRRYYGCYSRRKGKPSMIKDPNCKNKIYREQELNDIILNEIRKLKLDPDRINAETTITDNTETLKEEIRKIDMRRGKLIDLYAFGTLDAQEIESKIKPLTERKNRLLTQVQEEEQKQDRKERVLSTISTFDDVIEQGSQAEIRLIIEELIERIEIDNDDVFIFWKF